MDIPRSGTNMVLQTNEIQLFLGLIFNFYGFIQKILNIAECYWLMASRQHRHIIYLLHIGISLGLELENGNWLLWLFKDTSIALWLGVVM